MHVDSAPCVLHMWWHPAVLCVGLCPQLTLQSTIFSSCLSCQVPDCILNHFLIQKTANGTETVVCQDWNLLKSKNIPLGHLSKTYHETQALKCQLLHYFEHALQIFKWIYKLIFWDECTHSFKGRAVVSPNFFLVHSSSIEFTQLLCQRGMPDMHPVQADYRYPIQTRGGRRCAIRHGHQADNFPPSLDNDRSWNLNLMWDLGSVRRGVGLAGH